jgi:hypothetical protein
MISTACGPKLPAVEVREIGMDRDFRVAWLGLQIGSDLTFSGLQLPQLNAIRSTGPLKSHQLSS